jgi:hypothetical protein
MSKLTIALLFFWSAAAVGQNATNPRSSITHFRIAEIYFQDLQPRWIEVWSHLNLGKIFDLTQQRERAINEYHTAQRTKDNTRGALDEAEIYLQFPYPGPTRAPQ